MGLFKTKGKPAEAFALGCLKDFDTRLHQAKSAEALSQAFFQQLCDISSSDTVGLFLKKADGKLDVILHGIKDPPQEISPADSRSLLEYAQKTSWLLDRHGRERSAGESQRLFLPGFNTFLICPLIVGAHNLGVLKFDFRSKPEVSETEQTLLELLSERFASHLHQIQQENELRQQRIDAWFDHVILKIKECVDRKKIPEILHHAVFDLKDIDVSLIRAFRLYMEKFAGEWSLMDISTEMDGRLHSEGQYHNPWHLTHFAESDKEVALYTQADCTNLSLQPFHSNDIKESLCLRTDFYPDLLGHTDMLKQPVIAVLWTSQEQFLNQHHSLFQRVVRQIGDTLAALPTGRHKGITEGRFQHKTREILDQILHAPSENKLIDLLMEKARELAPVAEAVSYGQIIIKKEVPLIAIRSNEDASKGYIGQHLLLNQGLWHKVWDSGETMVVNNQYDVDVPKITSAPIDNPQSALCIPIIERTGGIKGMLNLCSSRTNAFSDTAVAEVEWLVQAFTSRRSSLKETNSSTPTRPDTQVIQCIRDITDLFARFTTELADYQTIFEASIEIIAQSLKASSWMLVRKDAENNYAIVQNSGCAPELKRYQDKLRYSPIRDLLEEEEELLNSDIRNATNTKYKNLLPLLRSDQHACLAARLEVQRIVPRTASASSTDEAIHTTTTRYGILLFHTSVGYFQQDQQDFLHIALTVVQELMKRQTLASELQRLMPLTVSGAMAAQVAHEIRNPCQPLQTLVDNLKKLFANQVELSNKLSEEVYRQDLLKMLGVADSALTRINRNVSHLMHLADIRSFLLTPVTVEEVLQDVSRYEWYGEEWGADFKLGRKSRSRINIRIAEDNPQPAPIIRFDRFRLAMVLTNLIKNAFEAINVSQSRPDGDEIVIGWEWSDRGTETIETDGLAWWHRGAQSSRSKGMIIGRETQKVIDPKRYPLVIYVSDNGPGMSLQVSEKLFEPFFSTKARGTGLGCTLSQMLMQKINGELRVISIIGSGTTFRLHFPEDYVIMREAKS